jgi:hypothetical protein
VDLTIQIRHEGGAHLGFPGVVGDGVGGGAVLKCLTETVFPKPLAMEEWRTGCRRARRRRWCGWVGRLSPASERSFDWSGFGRRCPQVAMVASICGVFGQKKSISGISRVREGGQGQSGSSGTYDVAVIYDERPRICGPPVKNFNGLAAS